jgi:hypothetical protein
MDFVYVLGSAHGLIFLATASVILYSDYRGFNYFRGKEKLLSEKFVKWSHLLVWVGLLLMITTGVMLTIPAWEYRLSQPEFYIKMSFVLVLVMNAVAIGKLSKQASVRAFDELPSEDKKTLLVSGGLSALGWIGAATIGAFFL